MLAAPKEAVSAQAGQGDPCCQLMVGKLYVLSSWAEGKARIRSGSRLCDVVLLHTCWCMWNLAQERACVQRDKPFGKAVLCEKTAYVPTQK